MPRKWVQSRRVALRFHRATGADLNGLRAATGCTMGCGLCEPYIERALETVKMRQKVQFTPRQP
jgi:NAD(P)H-nitrite reductase large subunit